MKETRTNAMRLLDQAGIAYRTKTYDYDEDHLGGAHVASQVDFPADQIFKTLVTRGEKKGILVFCIPITTELDLKKAAKAVGDKKVEMIHVKEILGLTGYVRGGCSPVGMKKPYPICFDETALLYDEIAVSAGTRGCQILLDPEQLIQYVNGRCADVTA